MLLFDHRLQATRARLLDASDGGLRIICLEAGKLRLATMVLFPLAGEAHVVELVWDGGETAGFRILRSARLRGFVDPEFEPLKARWDEMLLTDDSLGHRRFLDPR